MLENVIAAAIGGLFTLLAAVVGASVAISVYRRGERTNRRSLEVEQQRLMVVRMLDTVERAIQARLTPRIARLWRDPNVDLALALPRLLLELPSDDLAVAEWTAAQVQRAASTIRLRPFVNRLTNIEGKLISWHRGDIPTSWFIEQLQLDPYQTDFRLAFWIRCSMWLRDIGQAIGYLLAIGLTGRAVKELVES